MEIKWYLICFAITMVAMFAGLTMAEQAKSECRIEAVKQHYTPEQTKEICK